MIFFNSNPGAIYIQKKSLNFYINGEEKRLNFPDNIISNGDIINPIKYEKLIGDFIIAENIKKQQIMLILAEEILFEKTILATDLKISNDSMDSFINMIPIEQEKLIKKTIQLNDNSHLFAVNRQLFEKIVEILVKFNFEVLAVVPLTIYSSDSELNENLIAKIYKDKQFLKETNFLNDTESHDNPSSGRGILTVVVLLIIIIIILSFLLINNYFKFSLPFLTKDTKFTQVSPQTLPILISTESASPVTSSQSATLGNDQLKVVVLNGTGIAGQASKIKNLLTVLGLLKINTDNAKEGRVENTVVVFSEAVTDELQNKITTLLENNFESVSVKKNTGSQSTDILITTGKPKATSLPD